MIYLGRIHVPDMFLGCIMISVTFSMGWSFHLHFLAKMFGLLIGIG
jgi:hypothetical protein